MSAKVRDYYAAETQRLLEAGTAPAAITARLGILPGSLGRALAREGRHDLARPFWREAESTRRRTPGSCSCGATTARKSSTRCHACGIHDRDERARSY